MHNNVGVVGIHLDSLKGKFGSKALKDSGNNFGNMLFTNAAYKQINGCNHIGFNFNADKVKESFDSILIPAANWINTTQDWGDLARKIEETGLPVTMMGLGAQIQSIKDAKDIPNGTKKLLSVISERTSSIAVRGLFTQDILKKIGIKNTTSLGCPSIFNAGSIPFLRETEPSDIYNIGIGPTRYNLPDVSGNRRDKQRLLYQYGLKCCNSLYFQSESYEISVLNREEGGDDELASQYYGLSNGNKLKADLRSKGKYHTHLDQWISDVKKEDFYIGTRIHGVIAAALAGTPAVLITHDRRTEELAESMCVPSISIDKFEIDMLFDMKHFYSLFDYDRFVRKSKDNFGEFRRFYESNGLSHNLTEMLHS